MTEQTKKILLIIGIFAALFLLWNIPTRKTDSNGNEKKKDGDGEKPEPDSSPEVNDASDGKSVESNGDKIGEASRNDDGEKKHLKPIRKTIFVNEASDNDAITTYGGHTDGTNNDGTNNDGNNDGTDTDGTDTDGTNTDGGN